MVLLFEFATLLVLLAGGIVSRRTSRDGRFSEIWRCLGWLSQRWTLAVLGPGLLVFVGSATLAFLTEMPSPCVTDEFSHLLAGDTFAHGRLANPPHPLWRHFETIHVIFQPAYVSKYPPAQGLFLALGQVLTGYPIVGVWLSAALACAALSWMLRVWLPPRWALLGALLTALRLVLHGPVSQANVTLLAYWTQSYLGATVPLLGGALLFGALKQLWSRMRARDGMLLAVGLAILANSRPFEGLIVSLPAAALVFAWILNREGPPNWRVLGRVVLPIVLVLALAASWMGYYNFRATGNPLMFPYLVHERTYGAVPFFLWQSPGPLPEYRHEVMRALFVDWDRSYFLQKQSVMGWATFAAKGFLWMWHVYLGVFLTIPLAALPWSLRTRWTQFAVAVCGLLVAVLMLVTWHAPQYAAPAAPLGLVVVLQCMRRLHLWTWHERPLGRFLVRPLVLVSLVTLVAALVVERPLAHEGWHRNRAHILTGLEARAGQHLVLVRYGEGHPPFEEWVYNAAEIDASKVVWARDLSQENNQELLDYFKNRQVWLLISDPKGAVIRQYRSTD